MTTNRAGLAGAEMVGGPLDGKTVLSSSFREGERFASVGRRRVVYVVEKTPEGRPDKLVFRGWEKP